MEFARKLIGNVDDVFFFQNLEISGRQLRTLRIGMWHIKFLFNFSGISNKNPTKTLSMMCFFFFWKALEFNKIWGWPKFWYSSSLWKKLAKNWAESLGSLGCEVSLRGICGWNRVDAKCPNSRVRDDWFSASPTILIWFIWFLSLSELQKFPSHSFEFFSVSAYHCFFWRPSASFKHSYGKITIFNSDFPGEKSAGIISHGTAEATTSTLVASVALAAAMLRRMKPIPWPGANWENHVEISEDLGHEWLKYDQKPNRSLKGFWMI